MRSTAERDARHSTRTRDVGCEVRTSSADEPVTDMRRGNDGRGRRK